MDFERNYQLKILSKQFFNILKIIKTKINILTINYI